MKPKTPESKHDRFVRLAEARTNKIIGTLRLLGNCSSRTVYDYSSPEVAQVFDAIEDALATTKRRFEQKASSSQPFSLVG